MPAPRLELTDANELVQQARRLAFAASERVARRKQQGLAEVLPPSDAEMRAALEAMESLCRSMKARYAAPSPVAVRFMGGRRA